MLRIDQNRRAMYANMVVMEMYSEPRGTKRLVLVGNAKQATKPLVKSLFSIIPVSIVSTFKWSENIAVAQRFSIQLLFACCDGFGLSLRVRSSILDSSVRKH